MRLLLPIAFTIVFAGWLLFRLLVKKDLRQNLPNVFAGLFFVGIWAALYYWWFA